MNYQSEQILTKIIRYSLPLLTIIISIFITFALYLEHKKNYELEKQKLRQTFIKQNKKVVFDEVQRVYEYINFIKETTEKQLKESIKDRVYEAHKIATLLYEKNKNTKSKEEIFKIIKQTLGSIIFNEGRGYYFIDDINGIKRLQPLNKEYENKDLSNFKDAHGYNFVKKIIKTIKNKTESFDTYYWYKHKDKKAYKKISFYKYFAPYNVVIGTGEYVADFEKNVKKKVLAYINRIRYFGEGYIFILDYNFNYLSHIKKEYLGKNAHKNDSLNYFLNDLKNMKKIAQEGEGFYTYVQKHKPGTNKSVKKTSFIKGMNQWKWIIGSGFYEDDFQLDLKEKEKELNAQFVKYLENVAILSSILIILLLFISIYVSKLLENKFKEYKEEIEKQQNVLAQQSKMASMGEMIANIAHQWRQPLSVISTAATGISFQKEMGILSDEEFYNSTKKINESSQYLSKTIDDFKNFFNPNKSEVRIDIKDVVNKTIKLVDAQYKTKNIKIIKDVNCINFFTLENELLQVLINILNNARDELIKRDDLNRYIFIETALEEEKVLVKIYDNAGGIKEKNLQKVFEPYFTTKDKSIGTGIGLYMSHEIICKHLNGNLTVNNYNFTYNDVEYTGAMFIIEIPI
ncbi:histidine kinase [Malaciobacter molluscorum]|uniref:sensor histidine kinase n=1 Tax=Malaciobacter molluscorum TaxID=1032072 RepID=UPI00100C0A3E|nr:cache domain-containing protein [Malaciobacter molluscorum]RXJ93322.1 histidine kinase [Malaciobacter molluscorum]